MEKSSFMYTNSSRGWISTAVSLLCSLNSRVIQQEASDLKVIHIKHQNNILKILKRYGTTITYNRPWIRTKLHVSVVVFSGASQFEKNGQIGILSGLS